MTQQSHQQRTTTGRPNAQRAQQFAPKAKEGEIELHRGGGTKQGEYVARMAMSQAQRRDLEAVKAAVEMEAALTADDFFYSWTVKSKDGPKLVEGISIDGALILLSNWGNCICKPELLEDEQPTHWLFSVTFIDLERGFQMERLFRQRKSESHQRGDAERLQDIAFQVGQSKAIRNLVLNSLPAWLQDAALAAAKKAAEKSFDDVPVEFGKFVVALAKHGVTKEMILAKLGKAEGDVVASDLVNLRGIGRAVRDGQTTIAREFWGELGNDGNDDSDGPEVVTQQAQQPTQTQASPPAPTPPATTATEKPQEAATPPAAQAAVTPPVAEKAPAKQDAKKGAAPREPGDDLAGCDERRMAQTDWFPPGPFAFWRSRWLLQGCPTGESPWTGGSVPGGDLHDKRADNDDSGGARRGPGANGLEQARRRGRDRRRQVLSERAW